MIEAIRGIDLGSRCKDRTFRVTLLAYLYDYPEEAVTKIIKEIDRENRNDKVFRQKVRLAVKAIEAGEMDNPKPD